MSSPGRSRAVSVDACAAGLTVRLRQRRALARARASRLRQQATEAARRLVEDHGATRAWLFGSLAWGEPHLDSDVDILVEGLAAGAWLAAMAAVERVVEAPVDLVRAEEAATGLVARVLEHGTLLHAAV